MNDLRDEIHNAWARVGERENGSPDVYDADVCNTLLIVEDMIDAGALTVGVLA